MLNYDLIDNTDYVIMLFAFCISLAYKKQEGKLNMYK